MTNFKLNNYVVIFILFLLTFVIAIWSHPQLEPKVSPDSYDYIASAEALNSSSSNLRPFLYPLVIRVCMKLDLNNWSKYLVIFQIMIHSIMVVLLYLLYCQINFVKIVSFLLALGIGLNPSILYYSTYLLPELFLGILITLSWFFGYQGIRKYYDKRYFTLFIIISSVFSGLALVTKPVWILGIIPLLVSLIVAGLLSKIDYKLIITIFLIHFSFLTFWEIYKAYNVPKSSPNILLTVNICMASLRSGLIEYADGTPLYLLIKEKNLLENARKLDGIDGKEFRQIYNSLLWEDRYDPEFAKAIIKNAPFQFIFSQMKNFHRFFINRMFVPSGKDSFSGLSSSIRYFYVGAYNNLYRPLLPILLFIATIMALVNKKKKYLILYSMLIILYFSLVVVIFSKSQSSYMRMRMPVEYILFFVAFLPIGQVMNKIKSLKINI